MALSLTLISHLTNVSSLTLASTVKSTEELFLHSHFFEKLTTLGIPGSKMGDNAISHLTSLTSLNVSYCNNITEKAFTYFAGNKTRTST